MMRLGRIRVVVLITTLVCLGSAVMTWLLWSKVFGYPFDHHPLIVAIVIPAVLCSAVTWYLTRITFRLHQLENELRDLATRDSLTGVYNRRAYLASSEAVHELMKRGRKPLVVAYLDIDGFKHINDSHGHISGDLTLTQLTQTLKSHLRKSDIIGRMGGDEFAITLPATDLQGARELLERIRAGVAAVGISSPSGLPVGFTISVGIAGSDLSPGDSLESVIQRADSALYQAKQAGRNCLVTQDSPGGIAGAADGREDRADRAGHKA